MTCLLATTSLALDDGGGRSILADGAGNRALSLGGAYAGISDDASAVIWNPGGLGMVQNRELQATYTDLMGMGFNEQYASFVLPNWRWGVASLTFRRFAVDGIEGRDERNILTDDDLSDNETELTLGYGREFNGIWSVGGGLKVRKQSLAGFSDSGLGLDLGMMVRPLAIFGSSPENAKDLTLGLALRNAVQPALRLNEEPVKDPAGYRAGAAYRYHFGSQGEVLVAMDVEKTRDMNAHFHGGIEASFVEPLALRLGTNNGNLVAGAGLRWQDLGVDYQFEDNPSEFFHRFGISMKFGKTRDENQQIALANSEADLQGRLDDAFAHEQVRRKMELVGKARSALREKKTEEAANTLAMIKVIDPDLSELPELEAEVLHLQAMALEKAGNFAEALVALQRANVLDPTNPKITAGLDRVRRVSDTQTKRTGEIRGLLDTALASFSAKDFAAAKKGFNQVLALAPGDKEAQSMLALTDVAIKTQVEGHLAQIMTLANAGEFDAARQELVAARKLDPQAEGLAVASQYLADKKIAGLTPTKTETPAPVELKPLPVASQAKAQAPRLTPQQEREIADLYRRGMAAMDSGRRDQAVHFWELVWSMDPDYQNVTEYLSQDYLARGMEFFVAGNLPEAVNNWESAVRVNPDDPKAIGYLERARQQADRMEMMDNQVKDGS